MTVRVGKAGSAQLAYSIPKRKPLAPIDNPFGFSDQKDDFRLGVYQFVEEFDDYIVCRGYDPNANLEVHTPSAPKTINVAKPSLLMRSPWDGKTVRMKVDDGLGSLSTLTEVTYTYGVEPGTRTAFAEIDGTAIIEYQRITMDYHVGDIIIAVQVKHNAVVDGLPPSAGDALEYEYDLVP
ncbi:MAG TPA: hypothetical protein VMX74_13345, partial [Pirellulales bacterium]|nr:hypothetical protein [Pirellulales bacterium]